MSAINLKDRLDHLWAPSDFDGLFGQFSTRPVVFIKQKTILFNDGQPLDRLFYIKEGFVKLYRLSENGKESTIYLYGPDNILGIRALTSEDGCAKHFAESLTDLKVITLEKKEYLTILGENPQYLIDLLHLFISRLNYTEKKLEGFILTDVTTRVAFFLSDFVERFCKSDLEKNPVVLPLRLTHQLIAEFVSSVRETVTVSLNRLEKEHILKFDQGKIVILDLDKLKQYTDSKSKK